jgi:hypothetical protein
MLFSLLVAWGKGTMLDGHSGELLEVFGLVTVRLARCEAMRTDMAPEVALDVR